MSPSRIQTAAVLLRQRRTPHLEQLQQKRDSFPPVLLFPGFGVVFFSAAANAQSAAAAAASSLCSQHASSSFTIRRGVRALFLVRRDGLLWRDSSSFPGYCMHNERGAELSGLPLTASPILPPAPPPLPPPRSHGLLAQSSCPPAQFIFSHVSLRKAYF